MGDSKGLMEKIGAKYFKKNIEEHPWRRLGDPKFDGYSKAIFQKVLEEDERAMKWTDDMVQIVGLYDQVIMGIHSSNQEILIH
jgi:hypothetical protein